MSGLHVIFQIKEMRALLFVHLFKKNITLKKIICIITKDPKWELSLLHTYDVNMSVSVH